MDIYFRNRKLQKICSKASEAKAKLGTEAAKKLQQRLMELKAAENLAEISRLPPARCHERKGGNRKGQFSVDLKHPYRLLFKPTKDPLPLKGDGGVDRSQVTEIEIIDIDDPH